MIRVVALWGAELGWRGQREWRKQFERLQYQALRKCTGAVLGANISKVNAIAGVEDVDTILDSTQARYMARCMSDPTTTKDLWIAAQRENKGRSWDPLAPPWTPKKGQKRKEGYHTIATRLLGTVGTSDMDTISWGQTIPKYDI